MHGHALIYFADWANVNKNTCKEHCDFILFNACRIQKRQNSWGLFVHSSICCKKKKKHAAFLRGIKNDCKYVESTEQSKAPAEPTERACWHCWLDEKDINHGRAALKPFPGYQLWGLESSDLWLTITISAAKKEQTRGWLVSDVLLLCTLTRCCQEIWNPAWLSSCVSEIMVLWAVIAIYIPQTDHLKWNWALKIERNHKTSVPYYL